MILATFNAASGELIASAKASDYLAAVDRAYSKLMALKAWPPVTLHVRRVR